ncbi:MAG TPA: ATP-binding protein [Xanthomonadales bacterium]|nr:ATP-binding protein [Xanthomonadales bacterium]
MNWLEIVWIGMSAASLTIGTIHLFVWFEHKSQYAHLLFFTLAASTTAFAVFELALMQAPSAAAYAATLRWTHVPGALLALSIIWFVRLHFNAGRLWLAWAACGLRLLALALNFATGVNVNFVEVSALDHLTLWGDVVVVVPIGIPNVWVIVPQISFLLLIAFVVDASMELWRRGDVAERRRAAFVGGGVAVSIAAIALFTALVNLGYVRAPTIIVPGVFLIVLAVGYELGWDLIAAARLAERVRASEVRFRAVVESVPSAIVLVDAGGGIVLANAQAERLFAYPRSELVGRPVEMLLPPRLRDRHAAFRGRYASDRRTRAMGAGGELIARRQDGSEFTAEVALSPMDTDQGLFVLASVVDISHRLQLEQATARQRDELAHLSRVAMLGELSGSLAHELNQPLAAILSNAQAGQHFLAQSPPRVERIPEILSDIVKSDHRARAVIERLRSLLKKEPAQHHRVDLNELIDESLRLLRMDLSNRGVTVETELAAGLPAVSGDVNQLQQVLLNLIINACDAMGAQADRHLLLRTRLGEQRVGLAVVDCGTGIPSADLERIFESFVTTKAQGLGLGLAICRSIVEAHGGRLWASRNSERGSTLHCELPMTRD